MTRQQKYPDTPTFHYHNQNPKNRKTGDCAIRAVSLAIEKPWEEVTREMAELSCKTGFSFASAENMGRYLEMHGFRKHKQLRKFDNTKYTGKEFCEQLWNYDYQFGNCDISRIIANIGGHHVVAIIDGQVNDIWDSTDGCIGNFWARD